MRRSILTAVVLACAAALACGGSDFNDPSSHGSASVTGLAGFTAKSAYAIAQVKSDGSKDLSVIKFTVLGDDWSCEQLRGSAGPPATGGVETAVVADGGVTPASYSLNGGGGSAVLFPPNSQDFDFGFDGTVTVTALDSSTVHGSFDVSFALSDGGTASVSGDFTAPFCDVPSAWK